MYLCIYVCMYVFIVYIYYNALCMSRLLRERMLTACTDVPADASGPISYFDRYG